MVVTGLTASALAVVTMLALQAKSSATAATAAGPRAGTVASGPAKPGKGGRGANAPVAVPGDSGTGRRVVYSLGQRRVWLVDPSSKTAAPSFPVQASAVSPPLGSYAVNGGKAAPHPGSDGVEIENSVLFTMHDGVEIGFSSAVDGSMASPDPSKHTGGIRESIADGKEMYAFASQGTPVVVIA
ncbi:hypothetical protein GXW83_29910 [Streptacidiphilus sp. PB12-B1b]|nr:hypothetical protein GXW83_29910 [Streptacidiphilus sp. PB12-B1b]